MRDIKFRAWVTLPHHDPYMEYPFSLEAQANPSIAIQLHGTVLQLDEDFISLKAKPATLYLSDQVILMQYTGLKDKNGREIYEGDIVRVRLREGDYFLSQMVWYKLGWKLRSIVGKGGVGDWSYHYFEDPRDREVIGNIYENPDLIPSEG